MTRINTNVSSLVAQNTLGRSNAALEQALTRLSTGLRINTGKDDPAGLIASENLRSDITSIKKAISNTDRANQVIATADSALGQVSSLLNDIRGLVTEVGQHRRLERRADRGQPAADRLVAGSPEPHRPDDDVPGPQAARRQPRLHDDGRHELQPHQQTCRSTRRTWARRAAWRSSVAVTAAATQAQVDVDNIPAATAATAGQHDGDLHQHGRPGHGRYADRLGADTIHDHVADAGGAADGADGNRLATTLPIAYGAGSRRRRLRQPAPTYADGVA